MADVQESKHDGTDQRCLEESQSGADDLKQGEAEQDLFEDASDDRGMHDLPHRLMAFPVNVSGINVADVKQEPD